MKCGPTGKIGFRTERGALNRAAEIIEEANSGESNRRVTHRNWRTYKCEFCGLYHLTGKMADGAPSDKMRYQRKYT